QAQVREECVVLEDEPDSPPVGREREPERGVEPRLAVERDAAASRLGEPGDDAQRGRLAGAGGPDERDRARDLEREVERGGAEREREVGLEGRHWSASLRATSIGPLPG